MKIILLSSVKSLGNEGEVLEVSEGYARNFLFPQHLAIEATEKTLREKSQAESAQKKKISKKQKEERKMAALLDGTEVIISGKADGDVLYAAIGPKQIIKALKEEGFSIKDNQVDFTPAKEVGNYQAVISFSEGFDATVTVLIEGEE